MGHITNMHLSPDKQNFKCKIVIIFLFIRLNMHNRVKWHDFQHPFFLSSFSFKIPAKQVLWQTVKTQMKCCIKCGISSGSALFVKIKTNLETEMQII